MGIDVTGFERTGNGLGRIKGRLSFGIQDVVSLCHFVAVYFLTDMVFLPVLFFVLCLLICRFFLPRSDRTVVLIISVPVESLEVLLISLVDGLRLSIHELISQISLVAAVCLP